MSNDNFKQLINHVSQGDAVSFRQQFAQVMNNRIAQLIQFKSNDVNESSEKKK